MTKPNDLTDAELDALSKLLESEEKAITLEHGYKVEGFYCDLEMYDYDAESIHVINHYGRRGSHDHEEVLTINRLTMTWDD